MRKIIMLTLVILAGVTLHTQAKDKNKKPNTAVQQPTVKFVSPSDTVSYIAGMAATCNRVSASMPSTWPT